MSHFFAMLSRMKYINRWGLMRNTRPENLSEHSLETAVIAHGLAVLSNRRFGGEFDPERAALLALFHDAGEILTGDLPTPVKYYNPEIKSAYKAVETVAADKLLSLLPADLREDYVSLLKPQPEDQGLWRLVKAADKLSALVKCAEEEKTGNRDFSKAMKSLSQTVADLHLPAADCFMEEFFPSYSLTLDEQD